MFIHDIQIDTFDKVIAQVTVYGYEVLGHVSLIYFNTSPISYYILYHHTKKKYTKESQNSTDAR